MATINGSFSSIRYKFGKNNDFIFTTPTKTKTTLKPYFFVVTSSSSTLHSWLTFSVFRAAAHVLDSISYIHLILLYFIESLNLDDSCELVWLFFFLSSLIECDVSSLYRGSSPKILWTWHDFFKKRSDFLFLFGLKVVHWVNK